MDLGTGSHRNAFKRISRLKNWVGLRISVRILTSFSSHTASFTGQQLGGVQAGKEEDGAKSQVSTKQCSLTALSPSRISILELQHLTISENLYLQSLQLFLFFPIHQFIPALLHLGVFFPKLLCNYSGFKMLIINIWMKAKYVRNLVTLERSFRSKVGDTLSDSVQTIIKFTI